MAGGVALGDRQGLGTNIDGRHFGSRMPVRDRHGQVARAGADIDDARLRHLLGQGKTLHHYRFAVRPRNQYRGRHFELEAEKFLAANKIGDRTAFQPPSNQILVALPRGVQRRELTAGIEPKTWRTP
jgi:hypothetical protein